MEFRNAFSPRASESDLVFHDDSLAQQSFKSETDINFILQRFGVTGRLPAGVRVPRFGDFTVVADFRSALHAVRDAELEFMKLPAKLRARFGNDPQQFLEFCSDEKNKDEMRSLGLLDEARAEPVKVPASKDPAVEPTDGNAT